ncbi:MAG: hypothetical protein LAN83_09425 [Acidobacteriia bacterium]|nr:hypothetical protein [Terriglobia bacterium]
MSDTSQYCWVVLCKNHRFHNRQNLFSGHRIPLGETDAFMPPPALSGGLQVRCDDCGQQHSYQAKDVLRTQLELPPSFAPHPLFR